MPFHFHRLSWNNTSSSSIQVVSKNDKCHVTHITDAVNSAKRFPVPPGSGDFYHRTSSSHIEFLFPCSIHIPFPDPYCISGYSGMRHPRSGDFFPLKASLHLKYNSVLSMNAASVFLIFFQRLSIWESIMLTVFTRSPTFRGIPTHKMDVGASLITPGRP